MKLHRFLLALGFLFLSSLNVQAQEDDKRTTSINFDDELIEGEVQKPELMYLLQKKQFNYKRLIKLRENFLPEMDRTAEDIQRDRGKD